MSEFLELFKDPERPGHTRFNINSENASEIALNAADCESLLRGSVGRMSMLLSIATNEDINSRAPSMTLVSDVAFGIVLLNDLVKVMKMIEDDAERVIHQNKQ